MGEAYLTRRTLLQGSLALTVAACEPPGYAAPGGDADPDLATLRGAIMDEERLLARYAAVVRHHPRLRSRLEPLSADHRAHLGALRAQVSPTPRLPTSSPPTEVSTPSPRPTRPVPPTPAEALDDLARRERAAAGARVEPIGAVPPFLAQLLASIGACEATHAALLTDPG